MKGLKSVRIVLSVLFFASAAAYLLVGPSVHPLVKYSEQAQIIPSLIGMTFGITLFWLMVTLLLGRVYCSTVCPIGTLQDIFIKARQLTPWHRKFSYRNRKWLKYEIPILYLVCLVFGLLVVAVPLEPWHMFRNIVSIVHPGPYEIRALHFTMTAVFGVVAGVVSFIILAVMSLMFGREYCNSICPIGAALGALDRYTLTAIEINPDKCISCMKCEDVCKSSCVKVVSRYVDNSRCVRCFDCTEVCPNDAIRLTINKHRVSTPMMKRIKTP